MIAQTLMRRKSSGASESVQRLKPNFSNCLYGTSKQDAEKLSPCPVRRLEPAQSNPNKGLIGTSKLVS